MNLRKPHLGWLFGIPLIAFHLEAADLKCQESVQLKTAILMTPLGWEVVGDRAEPQLDHVTFYLMHPQEGGSLVPDRTQKIGSEERVTWTFPRNPGDTFWLGCAYQNTTLVLVQKLSAQTGQCVVRYDLLQTGRRLRVKGISCK